MTACQSCGHTRAAGLVFNLGATLITLGVSIFLAGLLWGMGLELSGRLTP